MTKQLLPAFTVLPSVWYENQPAAILESYALGKPVVAARLGGVPELVDEGSTGLLFEPGNVAELREQIRFLLDRPETRRAWGMNGKRKVLSQFTSAAHYEGLMQAYERVRGRAAAASAS